MSANNENGGLGGGGGGGERERETGLTSIPVSNHAATNSTLVLACTCAIIQQQYIGGENGREHYIHMRTYMNIYYFIYYGVDKHCFHLLARKSKMTFRSWHCINLAWIIVQ